MKGLHAWPGAAAANNPSTAPLKLLLLVSAICNAAWLAMFLIMLHRQHTQTHSAAADLYHATVAVQYHHDPGQWRELVRDGTSQDQGFPDRSDQHALPPQEQQLESQPLQPHAAPVGIGVEQVGLLAQLQQQQQDKQQPSLPSQHQQQQRRQKQQHQQQQQQQQKPPLHLQHQQQQRRQQQQWRQQQQPQQQLPSQPRAQPPPQAPALFFSPEDIAQQQERNRQPVDVVYLWVNGSDPQLQQDLQHYKSQAPGKSSGNSDATNPSRQARFAAGMDELRYGIRSLQVHMPWYRHLYIVTNGQVPRWLNTSNPRVTVVPESSIFSNASHLPTFNSNSVQAHVANIPSLSESFVMLDDDLFLTQSWAMGDFVGPDGGQILTGSTPTTKIKANNPYLETIKHLDAVFDERLGTWQRTDPSHAPHFMQRHWVEQLHAALPDVFERTSASRFRSPTDANHFAAYQWYVSRYQPGAHPTHPDSMFGFLSIDSGSAAHLLFAAVNDLLDARNETASLNRTAKAAAAVTSSPAKAAAAVAAVAQHGRGKSLSAAAQRFTTARLRTAWLRPSVKVVCMQDELGDAYENSRPLVDAVVREFLASRYPSPSHYELPVGQSNGCSRRLPIQTFGQLPTAADYVEACG